MKESLNLQPDVRILNGKRVYFYSLTQLEAIVPVDQRIGKTVQRTTDNTFFKKRGKMSSGMQ